MPKTFLGGCACGALRYEISGEPAAMLHCQCRQCQRDSGTGHQSHVTFVGAQMASVGEMSHWESTGDGGTVKRRGFCSTCGSSLYTVLEVMEGTVCIKGGGLNGGQASLGDKIETEFYCKDRVGYLGGVEGSKQESHFG